MTVIMDDDPPGTLRLEGQVIDSDESPVPNVVVVLSSNPPRSVESQEDGSFFFADLVGRRYELIARSQRGVAGPVATRLTADSEPVVLRLEEASAVRVTVIDAKDKKPIGDATVELRRLDSQSGTTDAEGAVVIQPVVAGRYRVVAYAPGYAKEHSWLRVSSGQDSATSQIALRRGAPVNGVVLGPDGSPVPGARVLYSGASEWAQQADPRRDVATADDQGQFRFGALPAGTFRFIARAEDHAPGNSELVTLDGSTGRSDIEITMEPAAIVRGRVESRDGTPVASARIRIAVKIDGFFQSRTRQAYSADDGTFEIRGLARRELQLVALHASGSSQITDVDMRTTPHERELTLVLANTDAISGTVVDSAGEPVEGAQVSAFPDWRSGARLSRASFQLRGLAQELTDAGGGFALRGLEPGAYELRASRAGSSGRRGGLFVREPTKARTGDKDIRIVLPADGRIVGKVAFASGEAPEMFTVNLGGWGGSTPFATDDGSFEMSDVAPQSYVLTIRGPGFDVKRVNDVVVEEDETRDLGTVTVRQGRYVAGRVTRDGQPVAEARVRAGRVIFGDGSSISARFGGPPGAQNAKEATTDEQGQFRISGVGPVNVTVVSEHQDFGRSQAVLIPASPEPVDGLELALLDVGALQGKITQGGVSAAKVTVSVQSRSSYGAQFGVSTGDDGTFRFDRLAPGDYKLSALVGTPFSGMKFYSEDVQVAANQTVEQDLGLQDGTVTLIVNTRPKNADKLNFAFLRLASGKLEVTTANQLERTIAALSGTSFSSLAFSFGGQPAKLKDIPPGEYTVCATPYPNELERQGFGAYIERQGDNMRVFCQFLAMPASPEEQQLTLEVEVPEFVPDPDSDASAF